MRRGIQVVAVIILVSCNSAPATLAPLWAASDLRGTQDHDLQSVALSGGRAFFAATAKAKPTDELRIYEVDASGLPRPIGPPGVIGCARIDEYGLEAVDGSVGFISRCFRDDGSRGYQVVRFDPAAGARAVDAVFDASGVIHGIGAARSGHWVASLGSLICESVVDIRDDGFDPIHLTLAGPEGSFSLDDPHVLNDCDRLGLVDRVDVANDGSPALLASTAAIGTSGPARLGKPYGLFIVTPIGRR